MKRVLLVSPYFIPSNLAAVHRVRLIVRELNGYGWDPIVITVDAKHYEERGDDSLRSLLSKNVRVERVGALPARICRALGIGDISLRGQVLMRRRVTEVIRRERVDAIFCTVLPGYTGLVGSWAKRRYKIPFVLDYQDPWVSDWGTRQTALSKAGLAHRLATWLEPGVVSQADTLTAVSNGTLDTLRTRNLIRKGTPIEIIPIGADPNDHEVAARVGRSWIQRSQAEFVLAYVGTVIEGMLPSVRSVFRAVRRLLDMKPSRVPRIHFIGTSAQPDGDDTLGLKRVAAECGVGDVFQLEPRRIGYLDALRTMGDADVLLLLGSQDTHYTASKIFPCWLSGKPMVGVFHSASTVNELARKFGGIALINYDEVNGPESKLAELSGILNTVSEHGSVALPSRNEASFEPYSARGVARKYAQVFDHASSRN